MSEVHRWRNTGRRMHASFARQTDALKEMDRWREILAVDLIRCQGGLIVPREVGMTARLLARAAFKARPDLKGVKP